MTIADVAGQRDSLMYVQKRWMMIDRVYNPGLVKVCEHPNMHTTHFTIEKVKKKVLLLFFYIAARRWRVLKNRKRPAWLLLIKKKGMQLLFLVCAYLRGSRKRAGSWWWKSLRVSPIPRRDCRSNEMRWTTDHDVGAALTIGPASILQAPSELLPGHWQRVLPGETLCTVLCGRFL